MPKMWLSASQPASNPSEYFRRTITVPILYHLLSELDTQFGSHKINKKCFSRSIFGIISIVTEVIANVSSVEMEVGEPYAVDLPNRSIHN